MTDDDLLIEPHGHQDPDVVRLVAQVRDEYAALSGAPATARSRVSVNTPTCRARVLPTGVMRISPDMQRPASPGRERAA